MPHIVDNLLAARARIDRAAAAYRAMHDALSQSTALFVTVSDNSTNMALTHPFYITVSGADDAVCAADLLALSRP
jgi:hypothetical protein